jgi:hypothetical protein
MSTAIRVLKKEWKLVATYASDYQIEGEEVECYFAESVEKPTEAPNGNKAGSVAVKTQRGGRVYWFDPNDGATLWAYPKDNGAVVIVDDRSGGRLNRETRFSGVTAFGETKTAEYRPRSGWAFPYNISVINYIPTETNGGTVTHDGSLAVLQTGTDPAGEAELDTRLPMRYFPGIGGMVRFTARFTEGVADSEQYIGYGDEQDGLFFGYNGAEFGVLRRAAGVDYFTPRTDWTDPLGVASNFDPTKLNVYQITFQWLGAGEIRFYIEDKAFGSFVIVDRIQYANTFTETSLQNPSLRIHAHVKNAGNTSNLTLASPSASVGMEGDDSSRALRALGAIDNTIDIPGGTETPILSVRAPETYEGSPNRLSIFGYRFSFAVYGSGNLIGTFRVRVGATLTGASWVQAVPGGSPAEYDISATALTGGELILSETVIGPGSGSIELADLDARLVAGELITLSCLPNKPATVGGSHTWDAEV